MTFKVRQKLLFWLLLGVLLAALILPVTGALAGISLSPAISAQHVEASSGAVSAVACVVADPGGGQGSGGGC